MVTIHTTIKVAADILIIHIPLIMVMALALVHGELAMDQAIVEQVLRSNLYKEYF